MRLCIGTVFELQLSSSIEAAGYRNIREFMEDYNKFSGEVSRYEAEVSDWERECREKEIERKYEKIQEVDKIKYLEYQTGNRR